MRVLFHVIYLVFATLLLNACNPHPESLSLLRKASRVAETNPDNVLLFLDSAVKLFGVSNSSITVALAKEPI